jgi:hypothetical protein
MGMTIWMINVHLGMPRVGFRSLGFVEKNQRLLQQSTTLLLPGSFYRGHMRSSVNANRNAVSLGNVAKVQELLRKWNNFEAISISQPALLGDPRQLLLSARARKKAASRVKILRAMFHGQEMCFHLLITSQAEYLYRTFSDEAEMLMQNFETFSWVAFIEETGLVSSRNSIIVWNCEHAELTLSLFLEKFINQPKSTTDALLGRSIGYRFPDSSIFQKKLQNSINYSLDDYQAAYRDDLAELKSIEGLTVMGLPS